jgi:alginate O-acetyltransferase complex protein AlgI
MLFNSFEFIFVFLPIVLLGYFLIDKYSNHKYSKIWLFAASLFFYGWWEPKYLIIMVGSILVNYFIAIKIASLAEKPTRKRLLVIGIVSNLCLLGYYKYVDFFISNANFILDTNFTLYHIILPIGISFFTFQQIGFLVDTYQRKVEEFNFVNYGVFVSFFPQLIAGPIVHHSEIMPQFLNKSVTKINFNNIARGVFLFNMGLAKKVIIADVFGKIANKGYANSMNLNMWESWLTSFAYTVQLYFDFSAYSDMAIGIGFLFNIELPINFWSPYKSDSIQQFYRRWHITLSRFLRDYIYIPLGGNQKGEARTYLNLFNTFLIGGLWHGANWTFVFWGGLNGLAFVVQRLYQKYFVPIPHYFSVGITFLFVSIVWVFFRAPNWSIASNILKGIIGLQVGDKDFTLIGSYYDLPIWIAGVVLLFCPNTNQIMERFNASTKYRFFLVFLIILNLTFMNSAVKQDFLYFNF